MPTSKPFDILKYVHINGLNITFDYSRGITFDFLLIKVTDKFDYSNEHMIIINIEVDEDLYPVVTDHYPDGNDISIDAEIVITFSHEMNESSVESGFHMLPEIEGTFNWAGNEMTFKPFNALEYNTTYWIWVNLNASDTNGFGLLRFHRWNFTTANIDTDGDGIPDETDPDDDNDHYLDTWEEFLGTNSTDDQDKPEDTDSDGKPDGDKTNSQNWMDIDDDGDGLTDDDELSLGTDPLLLDTDGDGFNDNNDEYPLDPDKWEIEEKDSVKEEKASSIIYIIVILVIIIIIIILFLFKKKGEGVESPDKDRVEAQPAELPENGHVDLQYQDQPSSLPQVNEEVLEE